jgi:hypothetical protein
MVGNDAQSNNCNRFLNVAKLLGRTWYTIALPTNVSVLSANLLHTQTG